MTGPALVARVAVSAAVYSIDRLYDYIVPEEMTASVREGQRVIVPFGAGNHRANGIVLELHRTVPDRKLKALEFAFSDEIMLSPEQKELALWLCRRYFCTFFQAADALLPPGIWGRRPETYRFCAASPEEAMAGQTAKKRRILETVLQAENPLTAAEIIRQSGLARISAELRQLCAAGILEEERHDPAVSHERTIRMIFPALPPEEIAAALGKKGMTPQRRAVLDCVLASGPLPEKEICYRTGVTSGVVRSLVGKGVLRVEEAPMSRLPAEVSGPSEEVVLNGEQQAAFAGLLSLAETGRAEAALLHGVTGSGKTLVYIRLIRAMLERGKSALLLVPEIALTPQIVARFRRQFGQQVAVVHSALTQAQRREEYFRILRGEARVIIGTRTAVFAPVQELGCIILDEEQEPSYHSETDPRYHAREVAKYRAARENCLLLLGSATPSVESYHAACQGKYHLFTLKKRYGSVPLPETLLADMRGQLKRGDPSRISDRLREELQANLDRGEQSILFLNRRGSARMAACVDCGYVPVCDNCSVAMVYHGRNGRLMCHHCGHSIPLPETCPQCGGSHIRLIGSGTQRIEEDLQELFPRARILRMDADTTEGRTSHEALLERFSKGEADILLGTQMVAKGLDFPNVTLVGVLEGDLSLYSGDYHAAERTFSLLAQVVGRAGRRGVRGRAVIQTYTPQNPVILAAAAQDYEGFYEKEILTREALRTPPFADLFVFRFGGKREEAVFQAAQRFAALLRDRLRTCPDLETSVLGPTPAVPAKVNQRYYYLVSVRGRASAESRRFTGKMLAAAEQMLRTPGATVSAEIDPMDSFGGN